MTFCSLSDIGRLNFDLLAKLFRWGLQDCVLLAHRNISGIKLLIECFSSLYDSERKFYGFLLKILRRKCQKCIPIVPGNISRNFILFDRNIVFYRFWTLVGYFCPSRNKKSGGLSKLNFTCL